VKEACKVFLELHLSRRPESNWDVAWFDAPPKDKFLKQLKTHQRLNHFLGINGLTNKAKLGRHFMRMQDILPHYYDFFPYTYILPWDFKKFEADTYGLPPQRTYIFKPV